MPVPCSFSFTDTQATTDKIPWRTKCPVQQTPHLWSPRSMGTCWGMLFFFCHTARTSRPNPHFCAGRLRSQMMECFLVEAEITDFNRYSRPKFPEVSEKCVMQSIAYAFTQDIANGFLWRYKKCGQVLYMPQKSQFLRRENLFDTDLTSPCSIGLNLVCPIRGQQIVTQNAGN